MAFLKWIPFKDLLFLQERMGRVFDEALSRYSGGPEGVWSPPTDILETKNLVILKVELPGVKIEDVDIEIKGEELILTGVRKLDKDMEEEHCHRMESAYGTFRRGFNLNTSVSKDKIKATLDDGILEIRVPKAKKKGKHVKVSSKAEIKTKTVSKSKAKPKPKAKAKPKPKAKPKAKPKVNKDKK